MTGNFEVTHGDQRYMVDGVLAKELLKIRKRVTMKDEDYFFVVDGEEGGGKSVLAMQLAFLVDPTFTLSRVVFTPEDFKEAILSADKGQAIVFDEAFRGLSSKGAMSQVNKLLIELMMECRQKNLIVFVVMPTFFMLERYVALWRAKGLFHVYRKKGLRGYWMFFNKQKKKMLYIRGRNKFFSYAWPKSSFHGRFTNHYTLDEEAYRKKKADSLQSGSSHAPSERFHDQRNLLLWYLNKRVGLSTTKIASEMSGLGWSIQQPAVVKAMAKARKEFDLPKDVEKGV